MPIIIRAPAFIIGDGVIEFDAVLEDSLEAAVEYTSFPLEIGANATDHGIIQPIKWTITGLASNNPIGFDVSQATGFLGNFFDSGVASIAAGLSAGFLAGTNQQNAGATLELLLSLMYQREPFDIDAVDIKLSNMVITNISRAKTTENEGGLEFVAELMELPLISTSITSSEPGQSQLREFDPSSTQSTAAVSFGEVSGSTSSASDQILADSIP